jgi:SPP1 family predicted phage head-tail adaptor
MRGGRLRHTVKIVEAVKTGVNSFNEPTSSGDLVIDEVRASIEPLPLSGTDPLVAQQVQPTATHKVKMRFTEAATPARRITFDSREFEIQEVRNLFERNRELILLCKEAV